MAKRNAVIRIVMTPADATDVAVVLPENLLFPLV